MNVKRICSALKIFFKDKKEEHVVLIGIKRGSTILFVDITERSSDSSSDFKFSKILKILEDNNCDQCLLSHNHPNGIALPSESDLDVTKELREFLKKHNITLIDHLVYADIFWRIFRDSFHEGK